MSKEKKVLAGKKILLGVTGGIAAYKAADLASRLAAEGAQVKTIMTDSAQKLITAKTFEAVTGGPVFTEMWSAPEEFRIGHIQLADWSDAVVIAPATADIIAKTACGICDDLLSTVMCVCWEKPILIAPAMNTRMWNNPVTQKNIAALKELKVHIVGPCSGRLACGAEGPGRMSEPEDIIAAVKKLISP